MTVDELYELVEEFFGCKIKMQGMSSEKKTVFGLLYDSFFLECNVNDRYGRFGAGLRFGEQEYTITNFLGERCSLNSDEESIKESLKIIDHYCQLRLPDKFLQAYFEVYQDVGFSQDNDLCI